MIVVEYLDQDEAVIMEAKGIIAGHSDRVDLVLTNRHLIEIYSKFFGIESGYRKYPLEMMKVYEGKPNIRIGKNRYGKKQLEIYFDEFKKAYTFNGLFVENKWASAITKAHKQRMGYLEKEEKIKNKVNLRASISEKIEQIKISKPATVKSKKCPKCGAELQGEKGANIKCVYCDTMVVIK